MNFVELGKALGWLGGVLYLGNYIEQYVQRWRFTRAMRAMEKAKDPSPPIPLRLVDGPATAPHLHTFVCAKCEQPVTSIFGCTHKDAPQFEHKFPVLPVP